MARINAAAGDGQSSVSPAMAEWLGRCRQISEESAGAFDVSIGRLSRLWDIDTWAAAGDSGDYELPRQEEIAEALATTGGQKIQLEQQADGDSVSIPAEMQLDLGAVGKGVALDETHIREKSCLSMGFLEPWLLCLLEYGLAFLHPVQLRCFIVKLY